jgi:uncharacterized repeat protein (TIGR01451 family)
MLQTIIAQVKAGTLGIKLALAITLISGLALAQGGLFSPSSQPTELAPNPGFSPDSQVALVPVSPVDSGTSAIAGQSSDSPLVSAADQDTAVRLLREALQDETMGELPARAGASAETSVLSAPLLPAVNPPPVQIFYIPLPENQIWAALDVIRTNVSPQIRTYISFAPIGDNTLIYYDHWEDGFEGDIANPTAGGSTEIWGDGDATNGIPPGFTVDEINAGDVIVLENPVSLSSRQTVIDFDGGDRIGSSRTIALTRAAWATNPGTILAGAVEVYETGAWGTSYILPLGETTFEFTGALIMATRDGTVVDVDRNGDGIDDASATIDEGDSYFLGTNLVSGATIQASEAVQVNLITGNVGQTESRWYTLAPVSQWSDSYYSPVDKVNTEPADAYLYNPDTSDLTVETESNAGAGSAVTIPAGSTARVSLAEGSGTHFFTTDGRTFYGLVAFDRVAYDWGFSLIPESALTSQVMVGWGAGMDPTSTLPAENGNPIWVTVQSSGLTDVCVDHNGDGGPLTDPNGQGYDELLLLDNLDNARVYDPDGDQTAMVLYVCDGSGARLAAAWGQDPETASGGQPAIDLGTAIPPLPALAAGKGATVFNDADGDGQPSPGDTFAYTIIIQNITSASLPGLVISDTLPLHTSYVSTSTSFTDGSTVTPIPDAGSTTFPLDEGGANLGVLPGNGVFSVTFQVNVDASLPAGIDSIFNEATATSQQAQATAQVDTPLNFEPAVGVAKTVYAGHDSGASCPGGELVQGLDGAAVTYCFAITNTGDTYLDQVTLNDPDLVITEGDMIAAGGVAPLAPGEVLEFYYETIVADDLLNTVVVAANPTDASGIDLPSLADVTDNDTAEVSEISTATVFGRIFEDIDGNGLTGPTEPGLPGVDVSITDGLGSSQVVTTDANGDYGAKLAAGSITVDVDESTLPVGAVQTAGTDPSTVVALRDSNTDLGDDGYQFRATVFGHIFEDRDGNGVQDASDPGIAGVDVHITDRLGVTQVTTTDANGDYSAVVPAGMTTADVDEGTLPAGAVQTAGTDPSTVDAPAGSNTDIGADGYQLRASIFGRIFEDRDGDGVQDASEPGIAGVDVHITDRLGVALVATTDASGEYRADVPAGQTTADVDESTLPLGAVQTAGTDPSTVDVPPGSNTDMGADGYQLRATVFGRIFEDRNGNGAQDPPEPGITGVDVRITDRLGNTQIATTDANGDYSADVPAGLTTADVDESTLPPGAVQTAGTDPSTVDVPPGSTTDLGSDGYRVTGTVNGTIYIDDNQDGVYTPGTDTPLAGVDVIITDSAAFVYSVTTGGDGTYSQVVTAGQIVVDVDDATLPAGLDLAPGSSDPTTVDVPSGGTVTVDVGYITGSIGDTLWFDMDGDGIHEPTEIGIPDATVTLVDPVGTTRTTITDITGNYLFQGLLAGSYTVLVDLNTLPAGALPTYDLDGLLDNRTTVDLAPGEDNLDADFGYRLIGGQGCTPGYWKQPHHFDSWTDFSPAERYNDVFGVSASFDLRLLEALRQGGGKEIALGRHAVAALLNATSRGVTFLYSRWHVYAIVRDAYVTGDFNSAKDLLEAQNQQGCPLN